MSVLRGNFLNSTDRNNFCMEQNVVDLLCMPQVLVDLIEGCLRGAEVQSLTDIILQDAALAAKVLLAAAKTGTEPLDPLEPVSSAVQQLGVAMVTNIALQSARQVVHHKFSPGELSFQYGLWFSSRTSGLVARCVAPSVDYPHIEEAHLCGLLLNLGIHVLFLQKESDYINLDVNPWSSAIQCRLEEAHYGIDHLHIADALIGPWQLESFLADAIRFLHADIVQIEQSAALLKISRLVQSVSQSPHQLVAETEVLAGRLFGLRKSEIDYLFDWASGLYPQFGSYLDDSDRLQAEMDLALEKLAELSFVLADQEAARSRLSEAREPEDLVRIARRLYLENSPAAEAVFLLLDQKSHQLSGVLTTGQPRMIGELKIPAERVSSLVSAALSQDTQIDSFNPPQDLTVADRLLLRICKSEGISCHPFSLDGQLLGAVVLGIDSEADLPKLKSLQIQMFGQVVSTAIMKMSVGVRDYFSDGISLLRRVSHEVNSPLTIIGNYAGALNHSLADDAEREMTESIKKEVKRIDDILNYYLGRQEIPGFPECSIDLNQLVQDTVDALSDTEIKPRQIEVKFDLQNNIENVATNPVLVRQILINLLKNAAEAVNDGGVIQVLTREGCSADSGRYVELAVLDNGPGIEPQLQEKLFRPVVSTKGAGHAGVGLSIVKGMIDDLGGRISCYSSRESGPGFHLQLPRKDDRPFDL